MAHDLECVVCGHKEAAHWCPPEEFPGVCQAYVSPDPEWEQAEWDRLPSTTLPQPPNEDE